MGKFKTTINRIKWFARRSPLLATIIAVVVILAGGGMTFAAIGIITNGNSNRINLNEGLVGWWKLDGNADGVGSSPNGAVYQAALASDRLSNANSAYSFDGTNDRITIPQTTALKPTKAMTIGLWVKPTNLTTGGTRKIVATSQSGGYSLYLNNSNTPIVGGTCGAYSLCAEFYINGAYRTASVSTASMSVGTWFHMVATYDGTTVVLYVDGAQAASTVYVGQITHPSTAPLCIGGEPDANSCDTSYFYSGIADDLKLYNRALTPAEVSAWTNDSTSQGNGRVQVADTQKGLVAQYKLDGDTKDATPYVQNMTAAGATSTTDRKGKTNSAMNFTGSATSYAIVNPVTKFPTTEASFAFWIKTTDQDVGVMSYGSTRTSNDMLIYAPQNLRIDRGGNVDSGVSVNDNQWHHVVITWKDSNDAVQIYKDGVLAFAGYVGGTAMEPGGAFVLGQDQDSIGGGFQSAQALAGALDDVRVYNRVIGANEVSQLYDSYNPVVTVSDLQKQLVGQWSFDGDAKDRSPYVNHGTVTGAILAADRRGRTNSAYFFDGVNDSIGTNSAPSLTTTGTLSAWIKVTSWKSGYDSIIFKGLGIAWASVDYGLLRGNSTSQFVGTINNGTNNMSSGPASSIISIGQWYHLVFTWDGTNAKFYTNGILTDTRAWTYPAGNRSGVMKVGTDRNGTGYPFNGTIDDVRIWSRSLSANEVQRLYETN